MARYARLDSEGLQADGVMNDNGGIIVPGNETLTREQADVMEANLYRGKDNITTNPNYNPTAKLVGTDGLTDKQRDAMVESNHQEFVKEFHGDTTHQSTTNPQLYGADNRPLNHNAAYMQQHESVPVQEANDIGTPSGLEGLDGGQSVVETAPPAAEQTEVVGNGAPGEIPVENAAGKAADAGKEAAEAVSEQKSEVAEKSKGWVAKLFEHQRAVGGAEMAAGAGLGLYANQQRQSLNRELEQKELRGEKIDFSDRAKQGLSITGTVVGAVGAVDGAVRTATGKGTLSWVNQVAQQAKDTGIAR
jgi:hypothetical protein